MGSILLKSNVFRSQGIYSIGYLHPLVFQYRNLDINVNKSIPSISNLHNFTHLRLFSTTRGRIFRRSLTNKRSIYYTSRVKNKRSSFRGGFQFFLFFATSVTGCIFILYYVEQLRTALVDKTGFVAGEILTSESFKESANKAATDVIHNVLKDKAIKDKFVILIREVLSESQDTINTVVANAAESEPTFIAAKNLSEKVVKELCSDPKIHDDFGNLLLSAINTETSVAGAMKWIEDITSRRDTVDALRIMISDRIMRDEQLLKNAVEFCGQVREGFFADKKSTEQTLVFLQTVLQQPTLHTQLSQALWEVVKLSLTPKRNKQNTFEVLNFDLSQK